MTLPYRVLRFLHQGVSSLGLHASISRLYPNMITAGVQNFFIQALYCCVLANESEQYYKPMDNSEQLLWWLKDTIPSAATS